MDSLEKLKRRLAALRAKGMIGLNQNVADLSPAARQLLALLTRTSSPVVREPDVRVAPPLPPRDEPPPPDPQLIAIPGGSGTGGII